MELVFIWANNKLSRETASQEASQKANADLDSFIIAQYFDVSLPQEAVSLDNLLIAPIYA